jgi:transcriptional regulator with XRE-family HTH domain
MDGLGEELRTAREKAGMSQTQLALMAQVDRSYISQIENDKKSPTIEMLFRLCRAMKSSPARIIASVERKLGTAESPHG